MALESLDDYQPIPPSQRVTVGTTVPDLVEMLHQGGISVEYRGTDPRNGDEYWHSPDPPISFVVHKAKAAVVVWHIGSDPDNPTQGEFNAD